MIWAPATTSRTWTRPSRKGSPIPHYSNYKCSECGATPPRADLLRKKVDFITLGSPRKVEVSRTLAWLCRDCLRLDEHYNLEPFQSPGMKSAPLEEVRAAQKAENGNASS